MDTDKTPMAETRSDPRITAAEGKERGTALLLSLFFAIIVTALVTTGTTVMKTTKQKTETNFRHFSQAMQFSRSGLIEGVAWFRRQTSQPVLRFEPVINTLATPPIQDTEEPEIGIVREFRIAGNTWGRYEVWKPWDTDPISERRQWRQRLQSRDISEDIGTGTIQGTAWRLRCMGYVFTRNDPALAYDEYPNHVVSSQILETDIVRLRLSPPGQAAICLEDGGNATFGTNSRIRGGDAGAGVYYKQNSGSPTIQGSVEGTPATATASTFDGSIESIFGASAAEISSIADNVVAAPNEFPRAMIGNPIVVAQNTDLVFGSSNPLRGGGVLIVFGDLTIEAGSASSFTGLIYVDGDLSIEAPAEITGAVIVVGDHDCDISGSGDFATVVYDEESLNTLRQEIGQYRLAGAVRPLTAAR